jgi:ADP-ribosylglycohydrolase
MAAGSIGAMAGGLRGAARGKAVLPDNQLNALEDEPAIESLAGQRAAACTPP